MVEVVPPLPSEFAPAVSMTAPVVDVPPVRVEYVQHAPVVDHVTYAVPARVVEYTAPAPAVTYAELAPVDGYSAPALAVA